MTGAVGVVTRGTTARRRLRRLDAWLVDTHPGLVAVPGLLAVDLGFGAAPVTTVELHALVSRRNSSARVIGLEIDPARVSAARAAERQGLSFAAGGFELAGLRPHLVRAANVLRQYDEAEVAAAWRRMQDQLVPGGLLVDATCDETGRLGAWIALDEAGPVSLTLACDLARDPCDVAARLPKALIHRNVPGEHVHRLLGQLDEQWHRLRPLGVFSARQRFVQAVAAIAPNWPLQDGPARWRRGELTVAWRAVEPR